MLQEKERRSKVSFAPAWCKRGDSNSHGGCHTHLKRACLPIPTLLQLTYSLIIIANPVDFVNSFFGKSQGLLNLLFCRAWGGWLPLEAAPYASGSRRELRYIPVGALSRQRSPGLSLKTLGLPKRLLEAAPFRFAGEGP